MLQENNASVIPVNHSEHYCTVLQQMLDHSSNNDKHVNYVVVSVLGLMSVLGILENLLVLWVLGFRLRQKTVAAVWVINLAMSDFLAILTLPFFTHYVLMGHDWNLGSSLCSAESSIFFLNMFVSSFLLAAISLDRCLLVAKPVWSQSRRSVTVAWRICAVGWLWAAVNTIPYFMFRSVMVKRDQRKLCYHNFALYSSPNMLDRNCNVRHTVTAVSKMLLAFMLPLLIIAVSYVHFGQQLQARRKRKESRVTAQRASSTADLSTKPHSLSAASSSTEHSATRLSSAFTKMVTSVIATFALCWAPYHIICLVEVVAQYMPEKTQLVEVGLPITTVFVFLNPLLNPIIYTFSCPHFCTRIRQSLGKLFEGLVEETGPLVLASGNGRRKFSSSPMTPVYLNSRIHHTSQASLSHVTLKRSPVEESGQTVV